MIQKKGGMTTEGVLIFLLIGFVLFRAVLSNNGASGQYFFLKSQCNDGVDNDGDGLVDAYGPPRMDKTRDTGEQGDPGCLGPKDSSEHESSLACDNGYDDDGDGLIDYPEDPGCSWTTDAFENECYVDRYGIVDDDCDDSLD